MQTIDAAIETHGRQKQALRDALQRKTMSSDAFLAEWMLMDGRRDELIERRAEIRLLIERFEKRDPLVMTPMPDALPEEERWVDLAAIRRSVLGDADLQPLSAPVRDWITVEEFAGLADVTPKQVRVWLKGSGPTHSSAPWADGDSPALVLGPRHKVILAGRLSSQWLDRLPARRERLAGLLTHWPSGDHWNNQRRPAAALTASSN